MEHEDLPAPGHQEGNPPKPKDAGNAILLGSGMIAAGLIISALIYASMANRPSGTAAQPAAANPALAALQKEVIPPGGVVLPFTWGDLGKQLVAAGVIDKAKFTSLYAERGSLPQDMEQMLDGPNNGRITMTPQNADIILNMLWALGLGQKSDILTAGPMVHTPLVQPSQFASTAGWTLATGNAMDHYAKHDFLNLTPAEEQLVGSVAKNIYRPCCGNSTYFPDCNHGMAMLGLLELMASQGATAHQMYRTALAVNSYWFPDTYLTIAKYLQNKGIVWNTVKPEDVLGAAYSSAQGYQQILSQTQPVQNEQSGGGSCNT